MDKKICYYCGSEQWEEHKVEYLYSRKGEYLLVRDMPVEVCANCSTRYYPGLAIEAVERLFFAIRNGSAVADHYVNMPIANYASALVYNRNSSHDQLPVT